MPRTNPLRATADFAGDMCDELNDDNVNSVDYWVARMGISDDEGTEFALEMGAAMLHANVIDNSSIVETCASCIMFGLTIGWIHAKREELMKE